MEPVFTTSAVSNEERVDLWHDFVSRSFAPVEISNFQREGFEAHISAARLGDLELAYFTGVEQAIERPQRIIKSGDAGIFVAVVQLGGTMSYDQGGEDGSGLAGSVTLFDMAKNYRTMFHEGMNFIDVSIPRKRVEALLGSTRNVAGLILGPDEPMTDLIIQFFRKQAAVAHRLSAETANRLGAIGADLLAAGILDKMGRKVGRSLIGAAVIARAQTFIRANLARRDLTPEMVATSENLSLRRLQELFAEEQITISDYVWEQRLLRARHMLESQAFGRLSIADIAAASGFVSLPHFSRRFRERLNCTPGGCRNTNARTC